MKIESKDTDIDSLLDGSYFHIPRFQRPYSWDDENINDFWEDLIANKGEEYFIGSMVVYKKSKQHFGVVDGQQRLTTITILLCVIRDQFSKISSDGYARGVHQLIERKDRDDKDEVVLNTETSFPYFQEHIQKFGAPDIDADVGREEENLKNAHDTFTDLITKSLQSIDDDTTIPDTEKNKEKENKLLEIRNSVLNLNLIFITLENEEDAYLIFETLNTRGKDLSLTDLVKNHFSKLIKSRGSVDQAKIKWETMLETIHNSSTDILSDNFIYHFWASRYDSVPLKKLFPPIKKQITASNATSHLNDLVADAKLYRSIHETSYGWEKNESEVSRSLWALQMFKLSQPTPAVLSLVRAYKNGVIKYAKLRDTLSAIEKFHFIFTAVTSSRSSGGISAMYSSFARKLFEAKSPQEASNEISGLISKLKKKKPSYAEFEIAFREIGFTNNNSKQKHLVRYILRKVSEHHAYKYPVDFDELTIEHIHPQSLSSHADWDEATVGCLGNLLFIDEKMNGKLDTSDFSKKIQILKDNSYDIPSYIEGCTTWTAKNAIEHTNNMAAEAYNTIWKL